MRRALVLLCICGSLPAFAVSLVTELTGSKSFTAIALFSEFELQKDKTFLTACFGSSRSAPLELGDAETPVDVPRSNQVCLGIDHGLTSHWRLSGMASLSPKVVTQIELMPNPTLLFRSNTASAGVTLGASYDSAGFSDIEWAVDGGLSFNGYSLQHEWESVDGTIKVPALLGALRPSVGALWILWDTEVSLRASYTFYLGDPLTAGHVSDAEIARLSTRVRDAAQTQSYGLNEQLATFLESTNRQTNAISGLASSPVWFELRPSVQHRFASWFQAQLTYTYDRYLPGEGDAHILSAKGTVVFSDMWRGWAALSGQLDRPERVPAQLTGIATLGAEVTF